MVGTVVPLAARDLLPQLVRGAHPLIGTFFSLGQSALLFGVAPGELLLIVTIVLLQGLAKLLVGRNYSGRLRRCHVSHDADWRARGPPATAADHG